MSTVKITDLPLVSVLDSADSLLLLDAESASTKRVSIQQLQDHVGGGAVSFADLTSTPNSIAGYGIVDAQPLSSVLSATTEAYTTSQKTKLASVAAGATVNASDAALRDRSTHTGSQTASTISDLTTAIDARITGKANVVHSHSWADLTAKPNTLSGYGITDGVVTTDLAAYSLTGHTHSFASLTGKPTSLSGYGITDGVTTTVLTSSLSGKADTSHTHSFASLTGKPTSLSGYGITDGVTATALSSSLSGKADTAVLANYQPISSVLTATSASYTLAEQSKLAAIAAGATVSASDAALRDRSTHTGTQAISTVEGLDAALSTKASNTHVHTYSEITNAPEIITRGQILAAQLGIY